MLVGKSLNFICSSTCWEQMLYRPLVLSWIWHFTFHLCKWEKVEKRQAKKALPQFLKSAHRRIDEKDQKKAEKPKKSRIEASLTPCFSVAFFSERSKKSIVARAYGIQCKFANEHHLDWRGDSIMEAWCCVLHHLCIFTAATDKKASCVALVNGAKKLL